MHGREEAVEDDAPLLLSANLAIGGDLDARTQSRLIAGGALADFHAA